MADRIWCQHPATARSPLSLRRWGRRRVSQQLVCDCAMVSDFRAWARPRIHLDGEQAGGGSSSIFYNSAAGPLWVAFGVPPSRSSWDDMGGGLVFMVS